MAGPGERTVDVVVAGAGPAGAVAARHLALGGRSVLIADRLRSASPRLGETLPGAALRLLAQCGLSQVAASGPKHARVGGNLTVWGHPNPVAGDAMRDPYGPGLRLDRAHFDAALRAACLAAGVNLKAADVVDLNRTGQGWRVAFDDGASVETTSLIDATGRQARLVRLMGVERKRDAGLVALYRLVCPEANGDLDRTLIEAMPDGWIYAGRLADGRWAVGYHTSADAAAQIQRTPGLWEAIVGSAPHLSSLLGRLACESGMVARDARGMRLAVPHGDGWAAVGDAALAFDPIAGQGLFNALRTGLAAAEAVLHPSADSYADELARVAEIYAGRRRSLYRAETRWSDRPFWRAQQA